MPAKKGVKKTATKTTVDVQKQHLTVTSKIGLHFPVGRLHRFLREGRYAECVGAGAPIFMAAVLDCLTYGVLKLAGNITRYSREKTISPRHIMLAVRNDAEFNELFANILIANAGIIPRINKILLGNPKKHKDATDNNETWF